MLVGGVWIFFPPAAFPSVQHTAHKPPLFSLTDLGSISATFCTHPSNHEAEIFSSVLMCIAQKPLVKGGKRFLKKKKKNLTM